MNTTNKTVLAGALIMALGGSVFAGELNVQGGSSTGGDATKIVGKAGGLCRFSVTGAFNDQVQLRLANGVVLFTTTIRALTLTPPSSLIIYSAEQLSDGQTRVLIGIPRVDPFVNGGSVRLTRGNVLIDSDPVIVQ